MTTVLLAAIWTFGTLALVLAWQLRERARRLDALSAGLRPPDRVAQVARHGSEESDVENLGDLERAFLDLETARPLHLVLSPPKTGSTTLVQTLAGLDVCESPQRAHFLTLEGLLRRQRQAYSIEDPVRRERRLRDFRESCALRAVLDVRRVRAASGAAGEARPPRPCVIVAVREPVARHLSGAFYGVGSRLLEAVREGSREGVTALLHGMLEGTPEWWGLDGWMDAELRNGFGFDPLTQPFPTERGWLCAENEQARFLLVRLEDFDRLPEALSEFYGVSLPDLRVGRANAADQRPDGELYRETLASIEVPDDILDRIYARPAVRHFYSAEEIAGFRKRWGARP